MACSGRDDSILFMVFPDDVVCVYSRRAAEAKRSALPHSNENSYTRSCDVSSDGLCAPNGRENRSFEFSSWQLSSP
jgi:hypothetical protein